jgi:hypothetical protein
VIGATVFLAVGIWGQIQGLPLSVCAMFVLLGGPAALLALLWGTVIYKDQFSKRAELVIEYDPKANLLPMHNNSSDIRYFVRNKSPKHAAQKLRVKIERLVAIGSDTAHPQAGQFNNVLTKLERFTHGKDDLPAHENVEVMGPVTYASNKDFFFRTDEPVAVQGRYYCTPGTYRMTVFATADNADPVRANFVVCERNGALYMDWERANDGSATRIAAA